jgi:hypothetical protein
MRRSWFLLAAFAPLTGLTSLLPTAAQNPPLPPPLPPPPVRGVVMPVTATTAAAEPQLTDDEALKQAGLSATDGAKLVEYLRQRTLTDAAEGKIKEVIRRFGADAYEDREKASAEIELFGPAAVSPLKAAERDPDPEVAIRATRALRRMEKVPHAAVAAAAARGVVKLKPPGAAAALLGYLPTADTESVADEIRAALVALAMADGKAEPTLVAALGDPSPVRRAAAYVALVEGGPASERIRIKETYPKVVEAVRKEPDAEAKFRGLWSLLLTTREKEFVPDLIGMIPELPRGRIWQLEELLLQLAGSAPTGGTFGKSADSLDTARSVWLAWWKRAGGTIDLTKVEFKPRVQGFTDLIQTDPRLGLWSVARLGPDLKEKWRISGLSSPTDLRVLPDGRLLIAEQNLTRVTERDLTGKILVERRVTQPLTVDPLPGGGMLVVCRGQVVELDKNGNQIQSHSRPNFDIMSGRRLPNGDVVFVTNTFQAPNCFRLDAKLKDTGKSHTLGRIQSPQMIDVIGDEKVLVCEFDQVVEYDLKTGKAGWAHKIAQPTSCQRLPNGNTLIACINQSQVVEVNPAGEVVWEYQSKDGLRVARVYRR